MRISNLQDYDLSHKLIFFLHINTEYFLQAECLRPYMVVVQKCYSCLEWPWVWKTCGNECGIMLQMALFCQLFTNICYKQWVLILKENIKNKDTGYDANIKSTFKHTQLINHTTNTVHQKILITMNNTVLDKSWTTSKLKTHAAFIDLPA